MVVYLDLIFIINLLFDFCLLLTVDMMLKRNVKWYRILLGAFLGEVSMLTLILHLSRWKLFIFKVVLSIGMSLVTFGFKGIKYLFYNVLYLYLVGIILGGFITFLYNEFRFNREVSVRYLGVLFASPLVLMGYYKLSITLKNNYNNRYKVLIEYGKERFEGMGFLDSGNKLVSPYSSKPIILVEKEYLTLHKLKLLPVPYNALNHHGILNCFKPDRVMIEGNIITNVLIGVSDIKFNIDGCNVLLNAKMEGI